MRGIEDLLSALTAGASFGKANFWDRKQNTPRAASCGVRQLPAESLYYTSLDGWRARPGLRRTPSISLLIGGVQEEDPGKVFPAARWSHGFPPAGLRRADADKASGALGAHQGAARWERAVCAHAGLSRGFRCRVRRARAAAAIPSPAAGGGAAGAATSATATVAAAGGARALSTVS